MSRFFIGRPIVAIVIAIVTVLGGLVALTGLPISQFPQIVPPQIAWQGCPTAQVKPISSLQVSLQPSPGTTLLSSHSSARLPLTFPSPQ